MAKMDHKSSGEKIDKYIPSLIESKWQQRWKEEGIYEFKLDPSKKSYYNLVELAYPSGDLHIGHWFTFTTADAHARYQKMAGKNVFFPNGFDAFGLPAENAAIKRNIHPRDWTLSNIETMKKQFGTMGTMIDWSHEAITCLPEYYRWNQWIFIKMFEKGLAYRGKAMSNWCPSCQTVLANEGIEDGKCWRCGSIVEQKAIEQWFLKITDYADRLLWENTDEGKMANGVDWPKSVKEGQNNWIGKSEGAEIEFGIENYELGIKVFTTRPDTLFGATFLVLAPEHAAVEKILNQGSPDQIGVQDDSIRSEVEDYVERAKKKTEMDRKEQKEKTGVFTGAYVTNPINSQRLPIWIADYVLAGYGTGAIMAVPGHDVRDHEFAKKYNLPVRQVIEAKGEKHDKDAIYTGVGTLINSGEYDGQSSEEAKLNITKYLESISKGRKKTVYHLRDWSVSRQRYWGTPVPIIYCSKCWELKTQSSKLNSDLIGVKSEYGKDFIEDNGVRYVMVVVPEKDLPVELPYEVDYTPKGKPPLATAEEWMNVDCPKCGGKARRDAETLDTFFDSSWYYYRYINPKHDKSPFDEELVKKIMPVDIYYGGSEHTLGHTLYARFFTKFFHDIGLIDFDEFAKKRIQHGIILGPDGYRMSKSRGNVVNPDDVVREYGADTVRMYLGFMIPFEATAPWNTSAISGIYRFLRRVWELQAKVESTELKVESSSEDRQMMARTIKAVGEDIGAIKFNTAIARMMEWLNYLSRKDSISKQEYKTLILLLAPFAPHIAEELWQVMLARGPVSSQPTPMSSLRLAQRKLAAGTRAGPSAPVKQANSTFGLRSRLAATLRNFDSVHLQAWPSFDEADLVEESVTIVIQVNGKVRDSIKVESSKLKVQSEVESMARDSEKVKRHLEGMEIKKVIFVPGRAINFVV